jgi:hypothetical protein
MSLPPKEARRGGGVFLNSKFPVSRVVLLPELAQLVQVTSHIRYLSARKIETEK